METIKDPPYTNLEWYMKVFQEGVKFKGPYFTTIGDHKLWNEKPAYREFANKLLELAHSFGIPCWDESELWWRTREFATTLVGHPWSDRDDVRHRGEYGDRKYFAYWVDMGEKEKVTLAKLLTHFSDPGYLNEIADRTGTPSPMPGKHFTYARFDAAYTDPCAAAPCAPVKHPSSSGGRGYVT